MALFNNSKKAGTVKPKEKQSIPRTAQQSVPYKAIYGSGIIELANSQFSRTYGITDICFTTADDDVQEMVFARICEALSVLSDTAIEFTTFNHRIDEAAFKRAHLMETRDDSLNNFREEYNNTVLSKLQDNNYIVSDKYLTITITAEDIEDASNQFARIDDIVRRAFSDIGAPDKGTGSSSAEPLTVEQRLEILWRMYHPFEATPPAISVADIVKQGISSKDVVCPDGIFVASDHLEFGDAYAASFCLSALPTKLSNRFIASITSLPFTCVVSTHMTAIPQEKAAKLVSNQINNIAATMLERETKANRQNNSAGLYISPELQKAHEEAVQLLEYITDNNQRLFETTTVFQLYAPDKDTLATYTSMLQTEGKKHMCTITKLRWQQEAGFATAACIGSKAVEIGRVLTTDTAALFTPFNECDLTLNGGHYYGKNSITGSLVMYDRMKSKNANGIYLGSSGSGKSLAAKLEILGVFLNSNDYIYVVDPDGEYARLAQMLGGEVVKIAPGNNVRLNPFDLTTDYASTDTKSHTDPIALKSDFIAALCEIVAGDRYGLSPIQKTIIDRVTREIYAEYLKEMTVTGKTADTSKCPTMVEFYDALMSQTDGEAVNLGLMLERFITGSFNTFSGKTTVNTTNRFVVFDIRDIGRNLYELGMTVLLDYIWMKMLSNNADGRRTWAYFDEFYLLCRSTSSAQYLQQITKRCRKFGGGITGISQDVDDLLQRQETRTIIYNSDFKLLFNQSTANSRDQLAVLLNISDELLRHITNARPGHGLLCTESLIVPIDGDIPTDTETYKLCDTSPNRPKTGN